MKQICGADIGAAEFGELSKVADLLYFDGPLLSLYRNNEGENLLYYWCDSNASCNRWLVFKISDKSLECYLKGKESLNVLVSTPKDGFLYCLDLDKEAEQRHAWIVSPKQLPPSYIPGEQSFYSDQPVLESEEKLTTFKVAIDGHWEFRDLDYFPRLFREAYAFAFAFIKNGPAFAKMPKLPMRDGWSSLHLFSHFLSALPAEFRPSLRGVRYASPGAIVFNVDRVGTAVLLKVFSSVRKEDSEAAANYKVLHSQLAEKRLLAENVLAVQLGDAEDRYFGEQAVHLAASMKLPNPEAVLERSQNGLMAAKVILAFYRLVYLRLLAYERDGKMLIPSLP